MKVTFRTVTGSNFSLDLEDSSKVSDQRTAVAVSELRARTWQHKILVIRSWL